MKHEAADRISLIAMTPGLDASAVDVVVTIPTFKRPDHLLKTLHSVMAQKTARNFAIIVMENEAEDRAGAKAAQPGFEDGMFKGLLIIAHQRGNCGAYNAGWSTALSRFPNLKWICVIDDDELADPLWLENLCDASERFDAALTGGPQIPVFEGNPPEKFKSHPVFTPHYGQTGPVGALYSSGNLALRADVLKALPQPFMDMRFNFTGGGDADLIRRSLAMGFKTAWCQEAAVRETIPENRVTRDWIVKRALRNGQLSALIEHRARAEETFGGLKTLAHTAVLLGAAPLRSILSFVKTGSVLRSLYPVHVALGRAMSEFGYKNEQYRNPTD